jgi:hypothetical protein
MNSRDAARELLANMRAAGLVVRIHPATLALAIDGPAWRLTRALRAALARVESDLRAEVLAEVADVAAMAEAAGLPSDIVLTFVPAPDPRAAPERITRLRARIREARGNAA